MLPPNLTKIDLLLHEVATPMTVILLNVELILKLSRISGVQRHRLQLVLTAMLKIRRLLNSHKICFV